jgi:hypothetical protein
MNYEQRKTHEQLKQTNKVLKEGRKEGRGEGEELRNVELYDDPRRMCGCGCIGGRSERQLLHRCERVLPQPAQDESAHLDSETIYWKHVFLFKRLCVAVAAILLYLLWHDVRVYGVHSAYRLPTPALFPSAY